ncbi:MAG TPA: enoyl-CoA hydratase [Acidimicrobiia bacterium]|nr:enoyl-CoA hydratase [Acidimicrobiia bacterium]
MAAEDGVARVRLERPEPGVLRIMLARPEMANAQDRRMLYELNEAFDAAGADDDVKVVIVGGDGRHFSAGHDLAEDYAAIDRRPVGCWGGFRLPGAEGWMAVEEELFLGLCWRWRNFPKPTIALAQGKTIAGGLMLLWSCDLIIASHDATFADPVVAFGVNGHEFFVHAWELGARKAKELLFTGGTLTAEEARALGMVNRVVAPDQLEAEGLDVARRIARMPSIGLKLAKQAVNQSLDAQGQWTAIQGAFSLHQLGHSHAREVHGMAVDPKGASLIRELSRGA